MDENCYKPCGCLQRIFRDGSISTLTEPPSTRLSIISATCVYAVWEEWFNLVVGLWLIATPWLFGFEDSNVLMIDVVIGIIVAALAAFDGARR